MDLPFAFDKIAAGSSILGRSQEIGAVVAALEPGGRSLAILAGPRTGKETIIREAVEQVRKQRSNLIVCEIDLFNIRTFADFSALWRERMRECAAEVNRGALLPFEISFDEIAGNKIFDLPGIIAAEARAEMVVYFKEFQNVLRFEDETFSLDMLERAWSRQHHVKYLFTGSFVNAMKSIFEERRLFYGMCRTLELPPLDKRMVCEYIRSAFLNAGRVIEMEEALAIFDISSGNMWYVKQLCSFCYAMPIGYVNRKIVNQARDTLLAIHEPRFKQILLDLTGNQINLLHAVVDGVQKFTSAETLENYRLNSSAGVVRSREALQKKEVLTFDRDDNARLIDPLFEYWLRNYYFV
ncbi:MAG: hypothetical protein II435_03105 [Bacteroidales bacterium]|nr:hypothetical protein [Bacteroidales bacterium]